jgi:hypothetical protein
MSAWTAKLFAPPASATSLRDQIALLLDQQRATWPAFRDGEAALERIRTKQLIINGCTVTVQANPGRQISTAAKVDPASIATRPCFLCPGSLPPLERGIQWGGFVVLPNPYPIFKNHLTIAARTHEPQTIDKRIDDMIALARALGPEQFVLYNGPRCGASAPDHMHFQACRSTDVPIFGQLPVAFDTGRTMPLIIGCRTMIACGSPDPSVVRQSIESTVEKLTRVSGETQEPMFNLIVFYREGRYRSVLFPRAKHRSACYFAPPAERLSISPAAVEMAGIVVVADDTHFDRVDEAAVKAMYGEVTLDPTRFSRLAKEMCI